MVTISKVVESIVKKNLFLQEAISRGIVNYAALAEDIKPIVDTEMGADCKPSAIMMALRRLSETLEKTFASKVRFSAEADVFVKSDLFEITVRKSKKTYDLVRRIYEMIDPINDFFAMTHGSTQVTIITNRRNRKEVLAILKGETVVKVIDDLAAIGTNIPVRALDECGYFYVITKEFVWENISIVEIISTLNELTLILNENDIPRAFLIVKDVIRKNS